MYVLLNFGALIIAALISGCNPKIREASRIFDGQTGKSLYKGDMRCWFQSFSKKQEKRIVGVFQRKREKIRTIDCENKIHKLLQEYRVYKKENIITRKKQVKIQFWKWI